MERVRKFLQLPLHERLILAQAWGLFLIAELALRILPVTRLLNMCKKVFLNGKGEVVLGLVPAISRLAWLVEVAGRYTPLTTTCLKKALVLSWLLGRKGIPTELRIGVARQDGMLKAHAWLDYDGQVIVGHHERERYEPLLPTR